MELKEIMFLIVVVLTNIIEAITGFAGTMLAMPPSMFLIGVDEAKVILNLISLILATSTTIRYRKDTNYREFFKISTFMILGTITGLYIYSILPVWYLIKIYGVIILIVVIRGLLVKEEKKVSKNILVVVLIVAGIIHGMFLSGGALLVIYAVEVLKEKSTIRATLAPVWIVLNGMILIQDIIMNKFTYNLQKLSLQSLIPLLVAFIIGGILHKKINQDFFVKLTYGLLIFSGVTLLV